MSSARASIVDEKFESCSLIYNREQTVKLDSICLMLEPRIERQGFMPFELAFRKQED